MKAPLDNAWVRLGRAQGTECHAAMGVHLQQVHCSTANGGNSNDHRPLCDEMFCPGFVAGVEQADDLACLRVDRGEVGPFMQITMKACECQVGGIILAAVLARDDVFDVEGEERLIDLSDGAVLASVGRPLPDEVPQGRVHQAAWFRERNVRALDCRTETRPSTLTRVSYSSRSSPVSVPAVFRSASASIRAWVAGSAR